jgi:hypothetical protein
MYAALPTINVGTAFAGGAGVPTAVAILLAPGAGKRYRLSGVILTLAGAPAAGTALDVLGRYGGPTDVYIGALSTDSPALPLWFPEPGIPLGTNATFDLLVTGSVAAVQFRIATYYYIDDV